MLVLCSNDFAMNLRYFAVGWVLGPASWPGGHCTSRNLGRIVFFGCAEVVRITFMLFNPLYQNGPHQGRCRAGPEGHPADGASKVCREIWSAGPSTTSTTSAASSASEVRSSRGFCADFVMVDMFVSLEVKCDAHGPNPANMIANAGGLPNAPERRDAGELVSCADICPF